MNYWGQFSQKDLWPSVGINGGVVGMIGGILEGEMSDTLAESPYNTIGRRFLSDEFFRQEQIENLIRSTSSYWMPSQFAIHHESLSDQHPSKLIWSVANAQVILKGLVESYGDILKRTQIRIENRLILKSLMHFKEYDFFSYTYYSNGIYIALDGPSIFKCISPVIGLQISEYQSPN